MVEACRCEDERHVRVLLPGLALVLASCGLGEPQPTASSDFERARVEARLEAELPDPAPLGGIQFVLTLHPEFCCVLGAGIHSRAPFEFVLDPEQPVTQDVLDGPYSAVAQAWRLSDVIDADGSAARLGPAGGECRTELELSAATVTHLTVIFDLGEQCRIAEMGREALLKDDQP